jgi:ribosomal protein L29
MKARELREKSKQELEQILNEKRLTLGKARFSALVKPAKNVKEISELKKDVAIILTVLRIKTRDEIKT